MVYDADAGLTRMQADMDGDGKADMVVRVDGDHQDFTHFVL